MIFGPFNESALLPFANTLKLLMLSNCKFTEITENFWPRVLWTNLSTIDLSGNPYACNCQLVWFIRWLKRTNVTVINYANPTQYRCHSPPELKGTPLKQLSSTFEMNCFTPSVDYWLDFVVAVAVLAIGISTVGSLLHRFRWHVRYWRFVYEVKSI